MGFVLNIAAALQAHIALAVHAHNQHIHIVEASYPVIGMELFLLLGQIFHRLPSVENVSGRAPHGSPGGLDPLMGFIRPPGAGAEENVPAAVLQGQSHAAVEILSGNDGAVIAIIILQEIHIPLCKGLRIQKLMLEAPRISGAGQVAGA